MDSNGIDPINLGQSCDDGNVACAFGAECEEDGNRAGCVCNIQCDGVTSEERRGVSQLLLWQFGLLF
jgi:hypothetical protein